MTWDKPKDLRYTGKQWLAVRKRVLAKSDVCIVCGHGARHGSPANSVDHIRPAELGGDFYSIVNLAPAHGIKSPCNVCAMASGGKIKGACQELKGALPLDQARARLKRRTGLAFGELPGGQGDEVIGQVRPASLGGEACPYATLEAAVSDLVNKDGSVPAEDRDYLWSLALPCAHGAANDGACWDCLPV